MKSIRHLVLGAARSGKTRFALNMAKSLANSRNGTVIYVATAEAHDAEMRERVARHRAERPENWRTLEAPRELGRLLASLEAPSAEAQSAEAQFVESHLAKAHLAKAHLVVVVDCLTLWLSNALLRDFREEDPLGALESWADERAAFMSWIEECGHALVVVSNEVGGGIVPASALARRFQSEQGWLNQDVASVCEHVTLVVAGLPLSIKG